MEFEQKQSRLPFSLCYVPKGDWGGFCFSHIAIALPVPLRIRLPVCTTGQQFVAQIVRGTYMGGETLIITKYRGNNGYKRKQPRTQGYSLGHGSAQSAWQGIIWFGEDYRLEWHNV